jgi:hypothetical protein
MRIVHEIEVPFSAGCNGTPYVASKGRKSHGFGVDMILAPRGHDPSDPYAEINIQGDARHVLAVLRQAVELIEETAQNFIDQGSLVRDWEKR